MVEADNVEVYLVRHSDGARYPEYIAPPGTAKYTGNPKERYIEAKTDERFKVVLKLKRGFNFMGHPKVRARYHVERGSGWRQTLSKRRSEGVPSTDRSHREKELSAVRQFIDGQYMDCGLTFGELKSGVSIPSKSQFTPADIPWRRKHRLRRPANCRRSRPDWAHCCQAQTRTLR